MDAAALDRARRSLLRRDPILARVIRRVGPCGLRRRGNPYAGLLRSVLYQQLAGAAAGTIERRLLAHFDGRYPAPAELLAAPDAALRAAGLSRQKIASFRNIATAFSDGTVRAHALHRLDDDAIVARVTVIKGIGEWTAHMLLIFNLGRLDVLPVGDYGIRKNVQSLYELPTLPDRATLATIGERWRPYRSVAAWYVWRAEE